jgi:hypothetical protein
MRLAAGCEHTLQIQIVSCAPATCRWGSRLASLLITGYGSDLRNHEEKVTSRLEEVVPAEIYVSGNTSNINVYERRRTNQAAGRSFDYTQSILQHLVDGRPSD